MPTAQKVLKIEHFGVERIPDADRTSSAFDLFRLTFGGANTFATSFLGSFPIILGLSFWQGAFSILLGVLVGAMILAPMALFGPQNGTSNPVSSGAHFGVHGRIVGSFVALLTAITFFSLSVWSSGDALIGGLLRMTSLERNEAYYAIAYGVFALLVLIICIYGFKFMLAVNKIAVWCASILFIVGFFAFTPAFDPTFMGSFATIEAEGFWAAFIGSTFIVMSNPISFGAFLGDWGRYIPAHTPKHKVMLAAFGAQIATLIPFFFGLITATIVATRAPDFIANSDYVGGLLAIAPGWFFLPLCGIALIGGFSTGSTALYGTGLDVSSIFTQLSRAKATILVGVLAISFIFIGRFAANLVQSVTTFATLIITCTTPWMVIMAIGYFTRRGFYLENDLQVFNRGGQGGAYWFHHGWNWRGLGVWIPSALLAICFVNIPGQFVGPLGHLFGDLDLSLFVALSVTAICYILVLWAFPEPLEVYGPKGPRAVRAKQR